MFPPKEISSSSFEKHVQIKSFTLKRDEDNESIFILCRGGPLMGAEMLR